jgi:hypothetical protein
MAGDLMIPVSLGELVDKITILEIKAQKFQGVALAHVTRELELLRAIAAPHAPVIDGADWHRLRDVNLKLWCVEDRLRDCEAQREFGRRFIGLARSVYLINDRRAALKRQLNLNCGSEIVEEKGYGSRS